MNESNFKLAAQLIDSTYIVQAQQARVQREKLVKILLSQRRIPNTGWDDESIELFLAELAAMDSNNFIENVGVGEREGRVFSQLVAKRHFWLSHGIGRSGDIAAVQPKAAGSSLIYQLTNIMALDLLHIAGISRMTSALVLPTATGMSLSLCLLSLKEEKKNSKFIIWPRIDQKACFKAILNAGLEPIVVEPLIEGDQLQTDLEKISEIIREKSPENILCVVSTTSCFAPRAPDRIPEISKICQDNNIFHVINNAYGVFDSKCCYLINEGIRVGRVDIVVQSTDKNLMVPVGGAIVASPDRQRIDKVSQIYPGRASASPVIDAFITFLSMGKEGYTNLCEQRKEVFIYCKEKLGAFAASHNEKVFVTPNNGISIALSVEKITENQDPTYLGSMLFSRGCSGARVISPKDTKKIGNFTFSNYGSHSNTIYSKAYMTVAAGFGMEKQEMDVFMSRLERTVAKYKKGNSTTTTTCTTITITGEQNTNKSTN